MKQITYDIKNNKANTMYVYLSDTDHEYLLNTIMAIMSYMDELSISQDRDVKELVKWFERSSKIYPRNLRLNIKNSPRTMLAGTINNIKFGKQRDFSTTQLDYLEQIINKCVDAIEYCIQDKGIKLQDNWHLEKIETRENLWVRQNLSIIESI